jgi:ferrous iron transport protein A
MTSLWNLRAGDSGCITGFGPDIGDNYRGRLLELGFHPGEIVLCVQSPGLGAPRAYRLSNTVYALDDEVARHVLIEQVRRHG